ncbi:MAG: hypothetical protein K2O91_12515 [Lachnospiraceae bacterium]|nr:hypothetical protein [Lachnospiraceae bacterium]
MKRKFNIAYKHTCLILLGAALMCMLCSCTFNGENAESKSESGVMDDSSTTNVDNENQYSEVSNGQSQDSVEVSNDKPQVSVEESNGQPQASTDVNNNEKEEQLPLAEEESYKAVLIDNGDFISTDLQNKKINLEDIKEVVTDDESISVAATKFSIIDLSSNGEKEIVLWLQINGVSDYGFEILRYQDGAVYGYTLPYREFINLKTDGTFIFSGGAADSGIGKLEFSKDGFTVDKLYYSESQYNSNNELEVQYFANGTPCSEEDFNNAMSLQEEKANVSWYDLTNDNMNIALENAF